MYTCIGTSYSNNSLQGLKTHKWIQVLKKTTQGNGTNCSIVHTFLSLN